MIKRHDVLFEKVQKSIICSRNFNKWFNTLWSTCHKPLVLAGTSAGKGDFKNINYIDINHGFLNNKTVIINKPVDEFRSTSSNSST